MSLGEGNLVYWSGSATGRPLHCRVQGRQYARFTRQWPGSGYMKSLSFFQIKILEKTLGFIYLPPGHFIHPEGRDGSNLTGCFHPSSRVMGISRIMNN